MLRELPDAPEPLVRNRILKGHVQNIRIQKPQALCRLRRHSHDVKVRVHGIQGHVLRQEPHDSPADEVLIRHLFDAAEDQRMMRYDQIRVLANRILNYLACCIDGEINARDLLITPSCLESGIVPVHGKGPGAKLFHLCHQLR